MDVEDERHKDVLERVLKQGTVQPRRPDHYTTLASTQIVNQSPNVASIQQRILTR